MFDIHVLHGWGTLKSNFQFVFSSVPMGIQYVNNNHFLIRWHIFIGFNLINNVTPPVCTKISTNRKSATLPKWKVVVIVCPWAHMLERPFSVYSFKEFIKLIWSSYLGFYLHTSHLYEFFYHPKWTIIAIDQ